MLTTLVMTLTYHLRLSSAARLEVAALPQQGVAISNVMDKMRNNLVPNMQRDDLLCRCLIFNTAIYMRRQHPFISSFFSYVMPANSTWHVTYEWHQSCLVAAIHIYILPFLSWITRNLCANFQLNFRTNAFCVGLRASAQQQQLVLIGICHCIWVGRVGGRTETLLEPAEKQNKKPTRRWD